MKHHCTVAGCRAHGTNRETGTKTSALDAAEGGFDTDGGRWVVICDTHGTCINVDSLRDALFCRAHPTNFCDDCRELASNKVDS